MSDQITYNDKADLIVDTTIDDIFKVSASDMNEIKSVVNTNAEEVGDTTSLTTTDKTNVVNAINELNTPEKWVSVGTTAPTDGRRVWFSKSKNLLPNNATTQTINGVTFTINADKSVTINGTASATADFYLYGSATDTGNYLYIPKGTYSISTPGSGWLYIGREKTLGAVVGNSALLNALSSQDCYFYGFFIRVNAGATISNLTLYPQIEKGSTASSYEAYIEPSINVDGDEIYNLKLQTPQKITLSFNTTYVYSTDLDYTCFRLGKLVFLFINTLAFKVGAIADFPNYSVIISGLPRPAQYRFCYLQPSGKSDNKFRASISTEGNMKRHWSADPVYGDTQNRQYSGCIVYETID